MTKPICDRVRKEWMAVADGYQSELTNDEIEAHLASCPDCSVELEKMKAVMSLMDFQKRERLEANVWSGVRLRLEQGGPRNPSQTVWFLFAAMAVLLIGYKIVELIAERDFGLAFKAIPLLIAVAVFLVLRENPFKISMELELEGE